MSSRQNWQDSVANNYRQYSAALELHNEEEKEWARTRLTLLSTCWEDREDLKDDDAFQRELKAVGELGYNDDPDRGRAFDSEWEIEEDVDSYVWFHSDGEEGEVDHVAAFVQEFFRKFQPDGIFCISWADTCSKPRIGEFSGGALVVTAEKIYAMEAQEWAGRIMPALASDWAKDYEKLYSPAPGIFVDTEKFSAIYIIDNKGEVVSWNYDEVKEDPSAWTASINAAVMAATKGPQAVREVSGPPLPDWKEAERLRREKLEEVNQGPDTREALEAQYGKVWDTKELQEDFDVHDFAAPFVTVTRKSDGKDGSLMFRHWPRFYFDFKEDS